jgi:fatty-acyl-CoA synthase
MAGYWDQPEATAEAIVDGWFHTGDGGSIDEFGYVTISDRKKDVIISGGENVSSIEVEDAIFQHPDVTEVAVIGVPDEKWGERPLASVVVREGATLTPAALKEFLSKDFAKWQLPDAWAFIDQVPRTSVGKFDKKVIRKWYADHEIEVEKATS